MRDHARAIGEQQAYARHLGVQVVSAVTDAAVLKLPYQAFLGGERINGGAISSLIDLAATCAFWTHPDVTDEARGATVGFTVNFLKLGVTSDLLASARVRRRGGTLCVGEVSVTNEAGEEVAFATVTYKLNPAGRR
jgi:uncharacterized protein (TIGR00369 family)